jgi:hypothetical protein
MWHIGQRRHSSTILDLSNRWRWVVNFMPWPLYSHGNSPRYPLDRRLGGPQNQSKCYGEEKNLALARKELTKETAIWIMHQNHFVVRWPIHIYTYIWYCETSLFHQERTRRYNHSLQCFITLQVTPSLYHTSLNTYSYYIDIRWRNF